MALGTAHLQPHAHWHDYHRLEKSGYSCHQPPPMTHSFNSNFQPLVPGSRPKGTLGSALCRVGQHQSGFVCRVLPGCAFLAALWKAKLFFPSPQLAILQGENPAV